MIMHEKKITKREKEKKADKLMQHQSELIVKFTYILKQKIFMSNK